MKKVLFGAAIALFAINPALAKDNGLCNVTRSLGVAVYELNALGITMTEFRQQLEASGQELPKETLMTLYGVQAARNQIKNKKEAGDYAYYRCQQRMAGGL